MTTNKSVKLINHKGLAIQQFAICMHNLGYEASLELHKIYRVLPDVGAAEQQHLRVVDESGEDYLYPESYFTFVRLPRTVRETLLSSL